MSKSELLVIALVIFGWAGAAQAAATDQEKCIAAKLAATGKYAACRAGADKKATLSGEGAEYAKCDQRQLDAWAKIEAKYGSDCLTVGDQASVQSEVSAMSACLVDRLIPTGTPVPIEVTCVACPDGVVVDGSCIRCPASGAVLAGKCWILGAGGDSCTAACGLAGMAYDDATDTYAAATAGSMAHCLSILDELGYPYQNNNVLGGPNASLGCAYSGRPYLTSGYATAQGSYAGFQRVCACH